MKLIIFIWLAAAFPYCFAYSCDQRLTATNGAISSPGYPLNYRDQESCTTTITVPEGKQIRVDFTAFHLEGNGLGCRADYLEITDGSISKKYCGNNSKKPIPFVSRTNRLTFRFKTDSSITYSGYHATYNTVEAPGCNQRLTTANGT
eukprot:UN22433